MLMVMVFLMIGTLYRWSLIFYGTAMNPLSNNPHVPPTATDITFATIKTVTGGQRTSSTTSTEEPTMGR